MAVVTKIYWVPIKCKAWGLELLFVLNCTEPKSFQYFFLIPHISTLCLERTGHLLTRARSIASSVKWVEARDSEVRFSTSQLANISLNGFSFYTIYFKTIT